MKGAEDFYLGISTDEHYTESELKSESQVAGFRHLKRLRLLFHRETRKGFVRNADQRSFLEEFRALSNSYFSYFYDQRISGRAMLLPLRRYSNYDAPRTKCLGTAN